ncbi:hypothetical protein HYT92_03390, partial [Candidatus Pacearchaeota archaeon]|nr:hypothetical protein [Candidatus Pacearchaeota archaeon]
MEEKKEESIHHDHVHHEPSHMHPPHRKKNLDNLFLIAALALVFILLVNIFLTFGINKKLKSNAEAAKEASRPAKIQLTLIKNSRCGDCFDASPFAAYVKSSKVELLDERILEFDSAEARRLMSKYDIQKIPAILVTGELDRLNLEGFQRVQDALILRQINPPYTDASGKIVGRVSLKLIKDGSCLKCNDLELFLTQLRLAGINIAEQKNISVSSDEGKALLLKYKIGFAPTAILSEDAGAYAIIQQAWP